MDREGHKIPACARLLTYQQAAAILGTSTKTLGNAVRMGDLEAVQAPGTVGTKGRRITRQSVEEWLRENVGEEGDLCC